MAIAKPSCQRQIAGLPAYECGANADSGEDLIVFERSLFSSAQTITLNLGELDITKGLDIIAPRDTLTGADLVTVSGNKVSRVFEIEKEATVNLSGLIVADGSVTGDNGGGIKNTGTLSLDSIIGNSASSGGGISSDSRTLEDYLSSSLFLGVLGVLAVR